jgi:hypothetical protein
MRVQERVRDRGGQKAVFVVGRSTVTASVGTDKCRVRDRDSWSQDAWMWVVLVARTSVVGVEVL